jgi:hypothetical protein
MSEHPQPEQIGAFKPADGLPMLARPLTPASIGFRGPEEHS